MTRSWLTILAFALSLFIFSRSGMAQVAAGSTTPPSRSVVDGNGVDLASGAFRFDRTDLTVGPQGGAGGLSWISTVADFGTISSYDIDLRTLFNDYYVVIGGQSDHFVPVNGVGQSQNGTGATLTISGATAKYLTRDGVIYNMSTPRLGLVNYTGLTPSFIQMGM